MIELIVLAIAVVAVFLFASGVIGIITFIVCLPFAIIKGVCQGISRANRAKAVRQEIKRMRLETKRVNQEAKKKDPSIFRIL